MKLSEFVVQDAIVPSLQATTRDEVIEEMVDALISAGAAEAEDRDQLIAQIVDREKHGSTGFGKGVAVPHVKQKGVPKMAAGIGVSPSGVDFNALDKQPVYTVVLLLSPPDQPDQHLQAMETIFSNLQKDQFRRFLRQANDANDVIELLHEADTQQLPN